MSMNSINSPRYRLPAGPVQGAMILLSLSIALLVQNAAKAGPQVLTPFGYRDSAKVHLVHAGYELTGMPDGHMRMENRQTGDHTDFEKPEPVPREPSINGWITFASWYNSGKRPVAYFTTIWAVPPAPLTFDGQTLFQFNSIEPASGDAILQPVLQYGYSAAGGGEYWSVGSWYVIGDQAYFSALTKVVPGQGLTGAITLSAANKQTCSYICQFTEFPATYFPVNQIPELRWCTETLEVYGVDKCSDFPNTPYSEMSGITIANIARSPKVNWSITNVNTSCGVQTGIITNGGVNASVVIYY